jgi:serine/threonine protein kinase
MCTKFVISFSILGTPTDHVWPNVTDLPNFKTSFPKWTRKSIPQLCPRLGVAGCDLLMQMAVYNPGKRLSAKKALDHPYFNDLDKSSLPCS